MVVILCHFILFRITFKFIDPIREIIFKEEEEELGLGLEIILGIIWIKGEQSNSWNTKELSLCHKLYLSNHYVFATWLCKHLIVQTKII